MPLSAPLTYRITKPDEWELTRAESRRLREEYLSTLLDLTSTVAALAKAAGSVRLREACRRTALKGHSLAQSLLLSADGTESASLDKWIVVDETLRQLETGEPRIMPPLPEPESAAESRADGGKTPAQPQTAPELDALTKREVEVLKCVAQGKSTKELAVILGIACKTAACHRYRAMDKLGIHDVVSLTRYAIRNGLIQA